MNNQVVMTAIERRMDWIFHNVICNPKNEGKDLSNWENEIQDLYDAYFELRGNRGMVFGGISTTEANNVDSIYTLVFDSLSDSAANIIKVYRITEQQFNDTEYRPLDVETEDIETEDGWNYKDVLQNEGGWYVEQVVDASDLIVWKSENHEGEVYYTVELK